MYSMMAAKFKGMFPFKNKLLFIIFINFTVSNYGHSAKLTVPRILLPYNTGVPTNYTLEVKEGGCYKWSSNRYDLVSVIPLPSIHERPACTTKAVISAISRYPERENAIILAEDEKTAQVLRCDVVIDSLHSIEIVTTTRVLFLEDAPEIFEVVAKNDQGDTFSSLAGVAFHWSLETDSHDTNAYGVLRFLKFTDSVYKTPETVEYWENQNLHGSMILIEGSKTGSAKVTVKPLDPAYKHIQSYEVSLVIVANLNLKPGHTYLLPGTKLKYHLELIKQGKAFPVILPSNQYYLEVVDNSIASLNTDASMITALKYGTTNIVVKDRYVTIKEIAYLPSSVIHVTMPSYLAFSVSPGDKWSLEEKKQYFVSVEIFDRNGHPIHITQDIRVTVHFPAEYFNVIKATTNGTYQEIQTLLPGTCKITADLMGVAKRDGSIMKIEPLISVSQDVTIYESISVIPSFTLLPWDSVTKPTYTIHLKAIGGTGNYNWKSEDSALASVYAMYENNEQKGRVTTFGKGAFKVHAIDAHLPLFTGSAEVSIQPVVDIQILPKEVEVEINNTLILPLLMFGYLSDNNIKMFSSCSKVPIIVDIDDTQKFQYLGDDNSISSAACRSILFGCISKGFSRIHVKYENGDVSLKKTTVIGCYRKLKVLYPSPETVIAIGSSLSILFQGGPAPWPRCQSYYINNNPQHNFVDLNVLKNKSDISDIHRVHAVCKSYGEKEFLLTIGNSPCESNKYPAVNKASYRVSCALPESVILQPVLPSIEERRCPASGENMIAIHSSKKLKIELILKDKSGREFHNISSLDIKWFLSDYTLAHFAVNEGTLVSNKNKYFQELHPYGPEGNIEVTASIIGYKSNYINNLNIADTKVFPAINNSLKFVLVEDAEVHPHKISVFNSPFNKVYLNISKGSGHFHVEASHPTKVNVTYKISTRQIEITPLETGLISISVIDLCLGVKKEFAAEIQIYGISAIIVDVLDKVQVGNSITALVEILNEENKHIAASVFGLMNLQAVAASDIISIQLSPMLEKNIFQVAYKITGLSLGETTFKVVTNANLFNGVQYSSNSYQIQVFPPLKLIPNHIVLINGATFQVLYSGGPQPQTNVEYFVDDTDIAVVSVEGVVEAKKHGKTAFFARSVDHNKKGNAIIFSQDKGTVSCIFLKDIKIHSPLSRMVVGTEMPLYAMGITEEENPFSFGTALPAAKFKWSVSNDKVATLYNLHSDIGLQETNENNFRVGIKAIQDGLVTVHLEMELPGRSTFFESEQRFLTSDIQIQVFKKLKLTNPEVEGDMILLSCNSELKLKCNRFGPAKVSFKILPPESSSSIISVNEEGNLVASSKTGSAVLLVTAIEEFGIIQELAVTVKVEKVAYMMIRPVGKVQTKDWPLTALPVGFTFSYAVSYHDNIGLQFDAVRSELKYRASRHNLARISFGSTNNSLSIQIVKPGHTVLKVWDADASIPADYIRVVAGSAIDPSDAELIVGDVACFGSPLLTKEGHSGTWFSTKPILSVHPSSGGAIALAPGTTSVIYSLVNGYSTSSEVVIKDATHISIVPSSITYLSNLPRSKAYNIFVVIQSNSTERSNNIIGRNCSYAAENLLPLPLTQPPFTCELNLIGSSSDVNANDIFHTTSGFDIKKGMYFCSIEPVNRIPLSEISALEGQLSLSVHLLSLDFMPSLSQQHSFSFLPAFYVQQEELILTDLQLSSQVVIIATSAVQSCITVVPSDQSILKVKPVLNTILDPSARNFWVELHDQSNLWHREYLHLHIDISCSITKQHVKLPVKFKRMESSLEGAYCSPPLLQAVESKFDWWFLLSVLSVTFFIFCCFYVFLWLTSSRRGVVTTQPVFLNRSNNSQNFSPSHSSHSPTYSSPLYSQASPEIDNISTPLRLCSLDTSPKTLRRRSDNVFS